MPKMRLRTTDEGEDYAKTVRLKVNKKANLSTAQVEFATSDEPSCAGKGDNKAAAMRR